MRAFLIVQHTPAWVFVLLALLVWLGIQAMMTRQVRVQRIFITPAIFITWGLLRLARANGFAPELLLDWLGGLLMGAAVGALTARVAGMRVDRARGRVELAGDWMPLVRNLTIFLAKYSIAVAVATQVAAKADLAMWDYAISGAASGYFIGWLIRFVSAYRTAPELPVAPAAAVGA
ncbi:MAG TPA: DUF6622 family protein [bacterium]